MVGYYCFGQNAKSIAYRALRSRNKNPIYFLHRDIEIVMLSKTNKTLFFIFNSLVTIVKYIVLLTNFFIYIFLFLWNKIKY